MSYSKLKTDVATALISLRRMNESDLLKKDIVKNEVVEDILRFTLFFEELEEKERIGEAKYSDFINQFEQINNYLKKLSDLLNK